MSEKPQTARDEQEDLLEQIIAQGLEKIKAPAQTAAAEPPPEAESPAPEPVNGGEAAPAANRKSRQSAVYLYLLILFGAAFLMLLLAYFVQQRSNESAISDLRDSMSLSRNELMVQIRELEDQNTTLSGDLDRLNGELTRLRQRYDEQVQDANFRQHQFEVAQAQLYAWDSFWMLEQFYQLENYEACGAVLLMQALGQYSYSAPNGAERRQEEIVKAVITAGVLDEDYLLHPQDYQNLLNAYSTP